MRAGRSTYSLTSMYDKTRNKRRREKRVAGLQDIDTCSKYIRNRLRSYSYLDKANNKSVVESAQRSLRRLEVYQRAVGVANKCIQGRDLRIGARERPSAGVAFEPKDDRKENDRLPFSRARAHPLHSERPLPTVSRS